MRITDFLGKKWDMDCMGCAISNRSMLVPGDFIQKAQYFVVHQDPLIPLPGFLVIASRRHIRSMIEMDDSEYQELARLIRTTHHAIKAVTKTESLTPVQEESSVHFHVWFFPWTQDVIRHSGKPSLTKIREIMSDYRSQPVDEAGWKDLQELIEQLKVQMAE